MAKITAATCALAGVVALVLALAGVAASRRHEKYLDGMWVGVPAFLKESSLSDMQLFLAPEADQIRQGYLIMSDTNGQYLANSVLEVRAAGGLQRWWAGLRSVVGGRGSAEYTSPKVAFTFDTKPAPDWPELTLEVSMAKGTLTLRDGEQVYAVLEKNHSVSAAAVAAYLE